MAVEAAAAARASMPAEKRAAEWERRRTRGRFCQCNPGERAATPPQEDEWWAADRAAADSPDWDRSLVGPTPVQQRPPPPPFGFAPKPREKGKPGILRPVSRDVAVTDP